MLRSFFKFDTVKEILKIRIQIYILMKKMIILGKIQFEPEQTLVNKQKTCGNESYKNGTKYIYASAADLLQIE